MSLIMINTLLRTLLITFLGSCAAIAWSSPIAFSNPMKARLIASSTQVFVGDTFRVTLEVRPLDGLEVTGAYSGFFFSWNGDPQIAEISGFEIDQSFSGGETLSTLSGAGFFGASISAGQLVIPDFDTEVVLLEAQKNGFDFISVDYRATNAGVFSMNNFRVTEVAGEVYGNPYPLEVERFGPSIIISPLNKISEPSMISLMGLGMLAVAMLRRNTLRSKQQDQTQLRF